MNPRIRELAQRSVYYDEDEESWEFDREKFAQLIILECANICFDQGDYYERWRVDQDDYSEVVARNLGDQILNRFGVGQ